MTPLLWIVVLVVAVAAGYWLVTRREAAPGSAAADSTVTDPVCGMKIVAAEAVAVRQTAHGPVYLCSPACVSKFDAEPGKHLPHDHTRRGHAHAGC